MRLNRLGWWITPALGMLVVCLAADRGLTADVKWETVRTAPPESVEELKLLQGRVKTVVDKCTPCTVGILIGMGAGSGVIVSEDGLVLTAAHVSGEAGKTCTIVLPSGRKVKAKTLGNDEKLDSGMIQITEKGPNDGKWPFLPIGKSADLKKGQWVVSLGHPGGWQKDRPPVARLGQLQDLNKELIRTNCTLVGGDSGGPLFDLEGNVVGIHSRIGLTLSSNIHVPADAFKTEWKRLVKGEMIGKPAKPATASFGVVFDDKAEKALIKEVIEDRPAAKAGLKSGDVITEFDGTTVASADDIRDILRKRKPDDEVEVKLKRGSKTFTMIVTLGKPGE
jgi:serine protease Do